MGRMYSAVFEGITVSIAQDLFELNAPSDAVVVVHEIRISDDTSEASEQLPFTIKRSTGSSGSGGATVTPEALEVGDAAFGGTVERNNTTRATTVTTLRRLSENMLNGVHWLFTPEVRLVISPSGRIIVGLETAPGSARTMSGTIIFEEIGG